MIQRKQSLFFLVGALLLSMITWYSGGVGASILEGTADTIEYSLGISSVLGSVAAITLIFLYSDRKRQIALALAPVFLGCVSAGLLIFGLIQSGLGNATPDDWTRVGFVVIALLFFLLARRAIQKDVKLVESMDRLR